MCTLIAAISLAILTAQIAPLIATGLESPISEIVCWAFVAAFHKTHDRSRTGAYHQHCVKTHRPEWLSWTIAISIAVSATFSIIGDVAWLLPAISPTISVLRRTSALPTLPETFPKAVCTILLPILISALFVLLLLWSSEFQPVVLACGAFAVLGHFSQYASWIRILEPAIDLTKDIKLDHDFVILGIALRAVTVLAIPSITLLCAYPLEWEDLGELVTKSLLAGWLKAVHWTLVFWMVQTQELPWEVAPTILTYAIAATSAVPVGPLTLKENIHYLSSTAVALVALFRANSFLPKEVSGRYVMLLFILAPTISLIRMVGLNGDAPLASIMTWGRSQTRHPIENFIITARADFALLQDRQSKTLKDARAEYRRRYKRDPPPGFDQWFDYARSHGSVLIDDFDLIHHDLKPFWKIRPQRLHESIEYISRVLSDDLQRREIRNGTYSGEGSGWASHVEDLGDLLQDVVHSIPDVAFVINTLDEPREVMALELLDIGRTRMPVFKSENVSIWDDVTYSCGSIFLNTPIAPLHSPMANHGLPFIQPGTAYNAEDPCQHPQFGRQHGIFVSPGTTSITNDPVPILSQAAPLGFNDIIYPTFWYLDRYKEHAYDENQDVPWENKTNTLYWAGSTTGAYSRNGVWKLAHRQRLVDFTDQWNQTEHTYLNQTKIGLWKAYNSTQPPSASKLNIDVKLTKVIQCDESDCIAQQQHFHVGDRESQARQFKSRFLFDVDGNSFSGRYYTLLQSQSVVLKQTVFREWHDERLMPWVHYIPVSLGMKDLPEILRYFSTEEGATRVKEIADAGRQWVGKALRKEDFRIYMFRLLLELARVMDFERRVKQ